MKAIIKQRPGVGLTLVDVPLPELHEQDVLIRVDAVSVCGSDVPIFEWNDPWICENVKSGQIIGHEFCGTVVDYGEHVHGFNRGELVTAEGHLNDRTCFHCRNGEAHLCPQLKLVGFDYPGAFAEFIAVPASNVVKLGDVPVAVGAILDPFGNAVHATTRVDVRGATVLVTGCGPIGLMAIMLAKAQGAFEIFAVDISAFRLDLASRLGAHHTLNATVDDVEQTVRRATIMRAGADILLEMSGSPNAIDQGLKLLRNGGQAVLMGLPKGPLSVDVANDIVAKGVSLHGVTGRQMFGTWHQAHRFIAPRTDGTKLIDLTRVVTHHLMIEEFEQAFELMRTHACGKVVLYFSEGVRAQSQEIKVAE